MNKVLTLVIILAALPACKSTKTSETTKTTDVNVVETAVKQNITQNNESTYFILKTVPFKEENNIADNVKNECHQLGTNFSNSIIKYAQAYNLNVVQVDSKLPTAGKVINISIDNIYSGGNAFLGHRKQATVSAHLTDNGEVIARTNKSRNSGGGFLGGFKGSCSVLNHTVNTLGNDIAKWLKAQS
jgi:hypothetical protein